MSGRHLSLALSLALAATPAVAAEHSSAHSGGGSSHAGSSHATAVPRGGSHGSGGSVAGNHVRPGIGRAYGHSYYPYRAYGGRGYYPSFGFGLSYGYSPFYYYGGYYPYGAYYPYGDYGYGGGYYGGGYRSYGRDAGALRLLVEPDQTKVYVDGYYSGIVDDYDGLFQRLYLSPGRHDITLRLEGFQTQHLKVYANPDATLKIHYKMVKGTGDSPDPLVVGEPPDDRYARDNRRDDDDRDRDADRARHERYRDDDDRDGDAPAPPPSAPRLTIHRDHASRDGGTLRLNVTPDDASVYVDGAFYGTARHLQTVNLAPGHHRIEVVRPGYRTFEKDVDLDGEKPADLDVALER